MAFAQEPSESRFIPIYESQLPAIDEAIAAQIRAEEVPSEYRYVSSYQIPRGITPAAGDLVVPGGSVIVYPLATQVGVQTSGAELPMPDGVPSTIITRFVPASIMGQWEQIPTWAKLAGAGVLAFALFFNPKKRR